MLCIDSISTDIYFNLAAEEYLLKNSDKNIFMVWQSNPCVVIGKHQDVYAEVNFDYVKDNNIKIARRYSGGGAVYHDLGNLNISFIETADNIDFDKYAVSILNALSSLGLNTTINDRRSIFLSDRKVSGSAQCVYKNRVLFHATLLFDSDLNKLTTSLASDHSDLPLSCREISVRSVKSPVDNINIYLQKYMKIEEFKNYLINYFFLKKTNNRFYEWKDEEVTYINSIKENKYMTDAWNMGF